MADDPDALAGSSKWTRRKTIWVGAADGVIEIELQRVQYACRKGA
jgi:hypothetical protein